SVSGNRAGRCSLPPPIDDLGTVARDQRSLGASVMLFQSEVTTARPELDRERARPLFVGVEPEIAFPLGRRHEVIRDAAQRADGANRAVGHAVLERARDALARHGIGALDDRQARRVRLGQTGKRVDVHLIGHDRDVVGFDPAVRVQRCDAAGDAGVDAEDGALVAHGATRRRYSGMSRPSLLSCLVTATAPVSIAANSCLRNSVACSGLTPLPSEGGSWVLGGSRRRMAFRFNLFRAAFWRALRRRARSAFSHPISILAQLIASPPISEPGFIRRYLCPGGNRRPASCNARRSFKYRSTPAALAPLGVAPPLPIVSAADQVSSIFMAAFMASA